MGYNTYSTLILYTSVFACLLLKAHCRDGSNITLKFLKTPRAITNLNTATFGFQILVGGEENTCTNCTSHCQLDNRVPLVCENGEISYVGLKDGNHTFEVCAKGFKGVGCATHNWIVDRVSPTAYVAAATSFTSAHNFSVNISFSEPCSGGGGGFQCVSINSCDLLVHGAGQVIPATLNTIQPNLIYSVLVSLTPNAQYGRVILVLSKNFCTDSAGNKFKRTENSSFFVHYDRRSMFVNLRTRVPERLLQFNREIRTVQATNKRKNLEVYLYFTQPVLNSSAEISNSVHTTQGSLLPITGNTHGNRRFGFQVNNVSSYAIVTVSLNTSLIISRYGTPVSPVAPVTFLYDSQRPAVKLSTTANMRTRHKSFPTLITFTKPVFGFNSSHVFVSGGYMQSFREISTSVYTVDIWANDDIVSVNVPENITKDVAGNGNLASSILQVRHYSVPVISLVLSCFATAAFVWTALVAGLLTVSVASLQSIGAFRRRSSSLTSAPTRNLFRIACHIQVFAMSRWLAVILPVEYYEFARGLQWSIPYLSLPWDLGHIQPVVPSGSPEDSYSYSSKMYDLGMFKLVQPKTEYADKATSIYGLPLTPAEYRMFFESKFVPEAEYVLDKHNLDGWRDFKKSMFWLAVIGSSLTLLHALFLFILKHRKTKSDKQRNYGALVFPRFEIFLMILALPCLCEASAFLLKGGSTSGVIVGILLLGVVSFLLVALLLFLSIGITFGKLLQYKEVHKEGQSSYWYQTIIRVTLGPRKRGQWTWIKQSSSANLAIFGPLFEDLRGPPKYMLSEFTVENPRKQGDRIIASDDETEDAEAPFIQKVFGILRIYYTLLESIKRVSLGIIAGAYSENWSSKYPTVILLSITSFQLFFMVLKKPFIKKKVQLVEIISVLSEVGLFASCLLLLDDNFSAQGQTRMGVFMLSLFLLAFLAQMINEWYALYIQTKLLDPAENKFSTGLTTASVGFLMFFIPPYVIKHLYNSFEIHNLMDGEPLDPTSSGDRNRSSGSRSSSTNDKPWLKQLKLMSQSSYGKERYGTTANDPSTSGTKWSGIWRSRSTSLNSSGDAKSKPKGLYKDLEAIFAPSE